MADINKTVALIFEAQDRASSSLSSIEKSLSALISALQQANGSKLDEALRQASAEAQIASDKIKQLEGRIKELEDGSNKARSTFDGVTGALKALAGSLVAKEFIEANVAFERFEKAMTLLKGSTQAANEEFAYIQGLANTLGLNVRSAADAYVQLTAATRGTALEGQATRDIFEAVSKAMSSLGRSSSETQGALLAIQQIVSKGTVSMEELRGQLGERLPGAFQLAASAMGLTTQELDKLVSSGNLTAEEFLPKFAEALRKTFGETEYVGGFEASLNRLKNAVDAAFQEVGKTGAFDALIKGIQIATAAVTGAIAIFTAFGQVVGNVLARFLEGDFRDGTFLADMDRILQEAAEKTRGARDAMLGLREETAKAGATAKAAGQDIYDGLDRGSVAAKDAKAEASKLDAQLKALGVDPKKVTQPIVDIGDAFAKLAANPAVRGETLTAGFEAALKKIKDVGDLNQVGEALAKAFTAGRLSSDEFKIATGQLAKAQDDLFKKLGMSNGSVKSQEDAMRKNAEATRKAEEEAKKWALEMEKLASNERIKTIEARVNLQIAQAQANAQIIVAAFGSINESVKSTGDNINSLFGQLKGADFFEKSKIEDQIYKENKRRDEAFKLQKELTTAQVKMMYAQIQAMERGDSLIKIDGAGLQPHLEAFMWEILKAIQVRVNREGLQMLLGMPA